MRSSQKDFSFGISFAEDPLTKSAIGLIAQRMENPIALTQAVERELQSEIEQTFRTSTAPDGSPWAALAESTLKKPGRRRGRILVDTGELEENAIAVVSSNSSVEVIFPEHGKYHMTGTRNMPRRQFAPVARDLITGRIGKEVRALMQRYATETRGRGFGR